MGWGRKRYEASLLAIRALFFSLCFQCVCLYACYSVSSGFLVSPLRSFFLYFLSLLICMLPVLYLLFIFGSLTCIYMDVS